MTRPSAFSCAEACEVVHATLDLVLVDAEAAQRLDEHLIGCSECREFATDLAATQRELRSVPELQLPEEVLERVWERTTRSPRTFSGRWLAAAAAVVVLSILGGIWTLQEPVTRRPTAAELQSAAADARMVLHLASGALRKTEAVAFRDVLEGEISAALRRTPVRWPERATADRSPL